MSGSATVRVMSAEEIASRAAGQTPPLRWPARATFFAERAMRLRQLAEGHAMGDFLQFTSRLAQAQQAALTRLGRDGGFTLPDAAAIDRASLAGTPPLSAADWPRDPAWHAVLREIVKSMRAGTPPGAAADTLARLAAADEVFLERQADALLTGVMAGLDMAAAPLVAAALQVVWTHMAIEVARAHAERGQTQSQPVGRLDDSGICPCCGSRPVASITRTDGDASGQRYLHCSLCGTEWHVPRVQCTHCGSSGADHLAYQSLDRSDAEGDEESSARAAKAAVQAETCEACGHYLKIVHGDREPFAEPLADDLASITLDLLVAETGKQRHGVNLMLLFGDPDFGLSGPSGNTHALRRALMARPAESVVDGSKAPRHGKHPSYAAAAASTLAQAKDLPAVDRLLREPEVAALLLEHGHTLVAGEAKALLERSRASALGGQLARSAVALPALAGALRDAVAQRLAPRLRAVLNLTGTVIHTNLGRALLADAALQHLLAMMAGPNNLEYDLESGRRGERDNIVEELLTTLTGAEAATVVNNNAAAVLLTIAALASSHKGGKEVIVSRGELVEIGGAFRLPDVMAAAGARLIEVGTTNRTHADDYERAITARTALLMKVHTSNYAVLGFASAVDEAELARIAHAQALPLATDLGSGSLIDLAAYGLPREPTPQDKLRAGCDIVTFSGDKLLGGPQAGLIVGSKVAIARIRKCPMKRALRMSKLPLAALEATLRLYLRPERLAQDLPTLRLLTRPTAELQALAAQLLPSVAAAVTPRFDVSVVDLMGQIGSGSLPVERLPSAGLALTPAQGRKKGAGRALDELAAALRALAMPVIGRIADNRLLLDLRCLERPQLLLGQLPALRAALGGGEGARP